MRSRPLYQRARGKGKRNGTLPSRWLLWGIPTLFLLLLTPFSSRLDLHLARFFYARGFSPSSFTKFFLHYGELPGFCLGLAAAALFSLSYLFPSLRAWRKAALALLLTLLLAAGGVYLGFKVFWGRARPIQLAAFGGGEAFQPYYLPQWGVGKSFPSGHATMGFYYLSLFFTGMRTHNRTLAVAGIVLGLGLGGLFSLLRMAQGGHFLTDTLFAGYFVWSAALFVDWLVFIRLLSK